MGDDIDEKRDTSDSSPSSAPEQSQSETAPRPSREDVDAFLSDSAVQALLPDLLVSVLGVMEQSDFSVPLTEAVSAVLLSNEEKYASMRASAVWPLFVEELLPSVAPKIEFFSQMIRANGQRIDIAMVRQWMPTVMAALRMRFAGNKCGKGGRGGRGWRGAHCGRGRGGFRGGFQRGWGGRGRWGHRGHRGRAWSSFGQNHGHGQWRNAQSQPQQNPQMREFEYTEELVAIMNMGFGDMATIKKLLVEHKGNKQVVVQALVSMSSNNK